MMKLARSDPRRGYGISRVFRTAFYSAEAQKSSSPPKESVHTRIFAFRDSNSSIIPLVDRWVEEGGEVKVPALFKVVKQLRTYRRYSHALQILQWMTDKMNFKLTPGATAVQLDLISKAHSIDKAEEYFNTVPELARLEKVQSALLNSYVAIKSIEKAEDLFQKMKDSGIINSALTYNVMLSLYYRTEDYEKVINLAREMEEKGIEFDSYTLCIRLNAYASSDLEEMEKLLVKMEADSHPALNFHAYFIVAKGYTRAGLPDKLLPVIRKSEKLIKASKEKRIHYLHLISFYAAAGQKSDVHRVWKRYNKGRVSNNGYLSVLSSLAKIEDVEGAEKIFEEWVSGPAKFDSRIVNLMISLYCKKRLAEKAFGCAERVLSKGHELDSGILQCLANLCSIEGLMPKAVEYLKNAICHSKGIWRLNRLTLANCLEYLKKEGYLETCHEILKSLRENGNFSDDVCDKLVEFVNSDEESGALAVLEADDQKKEAETSV